ncbi:MAG: endonuclease/exonuclease/phosphatase family protein [Treponematales bacterium]
MKIVSWNCSYEGGFNEKKRNALKKVSADVYVVQECTYSESVTFQKEGDFASSFWYGDGKDSRLGIGIFSKSHEVKLHPKFDYRNKFRYVVPFSLVVDGKEVVLFAVWTKGAIDGDKTHHCLAYDDNLGEACKTYQSLLGQRAIVIGDFNTASNDRDNEHKQRYTDLCSKLPGLFDCADEAVRWKNTFSADMGKAKFRDDFCFVSSDLKDKAKQVVLDDGWKNVRWRGLSDHCPIIVELELRD